MCKKFKCSILAVLAISLVAGLLISVGTRYGYKVHNVFLLKESGPPIKGNESKVELPVPVKGHEVWIDLPVPKSEEFYPYKYKCASYSGFPLSAYDKCATNVFVTNNKVGMDCFNYKWGEWSIIFNWAIWSITIYVILRLLSHKSKKYNK